MLQDWAICALGTYPRLAPHTGVFHALTSASEKGELAKKPSYVVTSSVAAIPASVYVEGSLEKFVKVEEMEINLRKRQFVSLHPQLKRNAVVDFLAMSGLLYGAYRAGKIAAKDPVKGRVLLMALFPTAWKLSEKAIRDIFKSPSFLIYDNLYTLLFNNTDVDAIYRSDIKIEMPAVNINKSGWTLDQILSDPPRYLKDWKNEGWVSVTNFRPEDVNLEREVRKVNYIRKMINGMRIEGHFNAGTHDNTDQIFDTATITNAPIHFPINHGYTNIVVLHYNSRAEGPTERVFSKWTETMNRCGDIRVSQITRKIILGWLRVNNDLAELQRQLENLKRLEELLHGLDLHSPGQEVIRRYIREQEDSYRKLSYFHKKQINFLFVGSEPIPDAHFSDFTQDQMIEGINIGWKVGQEIVPQINKMISA